MKKSEIEVEQPQPTEEEFEKALDEITNHLMDISIEKANGNHRLAINAMMAALANSMALAQVSFDEEFLYALSETYKIAKEVFEEENHVCDDNCNAEKEKGPN